MAKTGSSIKITVTDRKHKERKLKRIKVKHGNLYFKREILKSQFHNQVNTESINKVLRT